LPLRARSLHLRGQSIGVLGRKIVRAQVAAKRPIVVGASIDRFAQTGTVTRAEATATSTVVAKQLQSFVANRTTALTLRRLSTRVERLDRRSQYVE
jgi:hypothetical protein